MDEGISNTSTSPEKFSVRWVALGAFIMFLALYGGEKMIWELVGDDTRLFLNRSINMVTTTELTDQQRSEIRAETLSRLGQPSIVGVGMAVLLAPCLIGFVLGMRATSIWNGSVAAGVGTLVALVISGALSPGGIAATCLLAVLALPGTLFGRKLAARRMLRTLK